MDLLTWYNRQPPVGKNKPFVVTLDGKPFAGFDSQKEADDARDMSARTSNKPGDAVKSTKWAVEARKK